MSEHGVSCCCVGDVVFLALSTEEVEHEHYKAAKPHNLVRNTGQCFMQQLLANFSPQKKPNARGGSEHVEVEPVQKHSP